MRKILLGIFLIAPLAIMADPVDSCIKRGNEFNKLLGIDESSKLAKQVCKQSRSPYRLYQTSSDTVKVFSKYPSVKSENDDSASKIINSENIKGEYYSVTIASFSPETDIYLSIVCDKSKNKYYLGDLSSYSEAIKDNNMLDLTKPFDFKKGSTVYNACQYAYKQNKPGLKQHNPDHKSKQS